MLHELFRLLADQHKPRPLTQRETEWRKFRVGNDIEYLGIKGKIVFVRDLYESNEESDEGWDGPAYITMRYINSLGEFKDINLRETDLFPEGCHVSM